MESQVLALLLFWLPLSAVAASAGGWVLVNGDGPDQDQVTLHLTSAKTINMLTCSPDHRRGGHWVTIVFHLKRDMHLQKTGHTARIMTPMIVASGAVVQTVPAEEQVNFELGGTDAQSDDISPKAPVMEAFARSGLLKLSALGESSSHPAVPINQAAKFLKLCGG